MRLHVIVECLLIALLGIVITGCENQQPVNANLVEQTAALEAETKARQLETGWLPGGRKKCETEKELLQAELDAARRAAAHEKSVAEKALAAEQERAVEAIESAQQAHDRAVAVEKTALNRIAEAENRVAELQKQLAAAQAQVADLAAQLKAAEKADAPP